MWEGIRNVGEDAKGGKGEGRVEQFFFFDIVVY